MHFLFRVLRSPSKSKYGSMGYLSTTYGPDVSTEKLRLSECADKVPADSVKSFDWKEDAAAAYRDPSAPAPRSSP